MKNPEIDLKQGKSMKKIFTIVASKISIEKFLSFWERLFKKNVLKRWLKLIQPNKQGMFKIETLLKSPIYL